MKYDRNWSKEKKDEFMRRKYANMAVAVYSLDPRFSAEALADDPATEQSESDDETNQDK
ncbi:MAG: hypothetical protein ACR2N7_12770 [Acidimicrobiia bacterium]